MGTIEDEKRALRASMRRQRRAISLADRERETRVVWERVLEALPEGPVFVYLGVRSELPTVGLIRRLLERTEVAIPRITGPREMVAARYEEPLVPGPRGVPTTLGPTIDVQTVLLPGLAFDLEGRRLGYGGSFYDAWLSAHPGVRTIGMGFGLQLVERVPTEPHDRRLDQVICGDR